jgi:hypothetical protein
MIDGVSGAQVLSFLLLAPFIVGAWALLLVGLRILFRRHW